MPVRIDELYIKLIGLAIILLIYCKILVGIPLGLRLFLVLSWEINVWISFSSLDLNANELGKVFFKYSLSYQLLSRNNY